jgi:UDP-N-acetylglucosamine--N-acetylmuramyl-(pentapeptide) pyrophosphoryl-undecaprenol N-acetylglucosamine transferase
MILVTVGMQPVPFDRLIGALEALGDGEELVVQTGASKLRPANAVCHEFLDHDALIEHLGRARVVIAHAGEGSTLLAMGAGKKPILVPRLAELGEHPDDHQHEFARRLDAAGLVRLVEDPAELPAIVASGEDFTLPPYTPPQRLVGELRVHLQRLVDR